MKYIRAKKGPVSQRPYYEISEIEDICSSELGKVGLLPDVPEPIRIDRFIEKRFNLSPEYADIGQQVLGYSRFGPHGVENIVISSLLDEQGTSSAERRLRSTLAHEAGHCLLHAHLFIDGIAPANLFGNEAQNEPRILCRDVTGIPSAAVRQYDGNWWELHANKAIGALLMPRSLVYKAIQPFLENPGLLGIPTLTETGRSAAESELVTVFDVNPVVVRIRLTELFPEENIGQLSL